MTGGFLLISHDRSFLQNTCQKIISFSDVEENFETHSPISTISEFDGRYKEFIKLSASY